MNMRFFVIPVTALLAALAGGVVSHLLTNERLPELGNGTIRPTRIELVDEFGRIKAFIGTDRHGNTGLVFLDGQQRERAVFGVEYGSYQPTLVMRGGDGGDRVIFRLSPRVDDRPTILLRDHDSTRVQLGFDENDAPGPKDEDWAIRFSPPHSSQHDLAAVGVQRDPHDDKMYGYVVAKNKDGQTWYEPK